MCTVSLFAIWRFWVQLIFGKKRRTEGGGGGKDLGHGEGKPILFSTIAVCYGENMKLIDCSENIWWRVGWRCSFKFYCSQYCHVDVTCSLVYWSLVVCLSILTQFIQWDCWYFSLVSNCLYQWIFVFLIFRRSPISIAAAVIYIITQLSDDKKPLKGSLYPYFLACCYFYIFFIKWF